MIKGVFVILLYIDTAMPILGREYGTYSFPCRQNIFVIFFVTGVVVNNNHNNNNANDDASTGINAMLSTWKYNYPCPQWKQTCVTYN